jgi:hypothetical protein
VTQAIVYRCTTTPMFRRGGNRSQSASAVLTLRHVAALWQAGLRAPARGQPLNRFTTVHWGAMGLDDRKAMAATSAFLTRVRDWLRDRGTAAAFVWVRENDTGDGRTGSHLHLLLHVPSHLRALFVRQQGRWAAKSAGLSGRAPSRAVRSRAVGAVDLEARNPDAYRLNLASTLAYLAKGQDGTGAHLSASRASAMAGPLAGLLKPVRTFEGGVVAGKRCGVSRGLSVAAR